MKLYAAYRASERAGGLFPLKSIAFMDYVRLHEIKNGKVKSDLLPVVVTTPVNLLLPLAYVSGTKCMTNTFSISAPCFSRTFTGKHSFPTSFLYRLLCAPWGACGI